MNNPSLVVDTDLKGLNDDAFAMHYLLSIGRRPDLVTTVFGNATAGISAIGTRKLLTEREIRSVPVVSGANHPLYWGKSRSATIRAVVDTLPETTYVAALSTTGHVWNAPSTLTHDDHAKRPYSGRNAVAAIARHLVAMPKCDVLALGPLTNVAAAVRNVPEEIMRGHRLIFSGGGLTTGNVTAHTEFNAFADPWATSEALDAPWSQVLVLPLEVTTSVRFGAGEVAEIAAGESIFGRQLAESRKRLHMDEPDLQEFMWDAVATVLFTIPEAIRDFATCQVAVEVGGRHPGRLRLKGGGSKRQIKIATSINSVSVMKEFINAFAIPTSPTESCRGARRSAET